MRSITAHWLAVGLIVAVTVGCSDKDDPAGAASISTVVALSPALPSAASAAAASNGAVTMADFRFSPSSLAVPVGATVTVTNNDATTHTLTSVSGPDAVDTGPLAPKASAKVTFARSGTYAYHCSIHNSMTGTVIVS